MRPVLLVVLGSLLIGLVERCAAHEPDRSQPPRSVILLIADGAGYNMLQAARLYAGEPLAMDGPEWTKLAASTHALRRGRSLRSGLGPLDQDPSMVYEPAGHFDLTPQPGDIHVKLFGQALVYPRGFAGYERHRRSAPDSAATATAMMTGIRTYNGAINVDGQRQPVKSVGEVARTAGKRVGVVSTVAWTHATPAAAAGAHNVSRSRYHEISRDMLDSGVADVLIGAGHPEFNDNGVPRTTADFTFYDPQDWAALKAGTRRATDGLPWTFVQEADEIVRLASGPVPQRLVVMPRVGWTLQQRRARVDRNGDGVLNEADAFHTAPGEDPPTRGLATLLDLARVGLNAVADDPDGFFLMIEGGAVDWAMHDNQLGRAIEEYLEFNATVRLVCDYLDAGTNGHTWENTLVIVTADHDHLLYGPQGDIVPFQELEDRGRGKLPGHRWLWHSHSNNPVPFFARGEGAERFTALADEVDAFGDGTHRFGHGPMLHQAEMGQVLMKLLHPDEPTAAHGSR